MSVTDTWRPKRPGPASAVATQTHSPVKQSHTLCRTAGTLQLSLSFIYCFDLGRSLSITVDYNLVQMATPVDCDHAFEATTVDIMLLS